MRVSWSEGDRSQLLLGPELVLGCIALHFSNCVFVPATNRCPPQGAGKVSTFIIWPRELGPVACLSENLFLPLQNLVKCSCLTGLIRDICENVWHIVFIQAKVSDPWNFKLYPSQSSTEITLYPLTLSSPSLSIVLCLLNPSVSAHWQKNLKKKQWKWGCGFFFSWLVNR